MDSVSNHVRPYWPAEATTASDSEDPGGADKLRVETKVNVELHTENKLNHVGEREREAAQERDKQTPISRLVALLARGLGTEQEEECLELLCRAAGRFEIRRADGTLPRELSKDPQLLARLTNMVAQAPTLRSLARCAVRQSLGVQFLPTAVKELPLPETIKDYLLLRD